MTSTIVFMLSSRTKKLSLNGIARLINVSEAATKKKGSCTTVPAANLLTEVDLSDLERLFDGTPLGNVMSNA